MRIDEKRMKLFKVDADNNFNDTDPPDDRAERKLKIQMEL